MGGHMIGTREGLLADAPAGYAASLWANKFDVEKAFRANSPLTTDQHKLVETTVIEEFTKPTGVIQRLVELGLVKPLPRPFAYSEISYHIQKDTTGAKMGRTPIGRAEGDLIDLTEVKTPIYYTYADFQIDLPTLETSRNSGLPLDENLIRQKARDVAEAVEESVVKGTFSGAALPKVGGNSATGLENAPSINTVSYGSNGNWDHSSKTVDTVLADVKGMFAALDADQVRGPVDLVIPTAWMNAVTFLRNANTDKTALQFLKELTRGNQPIGIMASEFLSTNTAVMYARDSRCIDIVVGDFGGQQAADNPNAPDPNPVAITVLPWQTHGGLMFNFKLICCIIPRSKRTYGTKSGIVKLAA